MDNYPKQSGISGRPFKDGDLYIEEEVQAQGDSKAYTRFVAVEDLNMSAEDIQKGREDGRVKEWHPSDERDTRADGATGPQA